MIPTLIALGMVGGLVLRSRRALPVAAAALVVASVGWSLIVDVEDLDGHAAAFGLAAANLLVGGLVGWGIVRAFRAIAPPAPRSEPLP